MKNTTVVLAMLLMTATAWGQPSRRETNNGHSAGNRDVKPNTETTHKSRTPEQAGARSTVRTNQPEDRSAVRTSKPENRQAVRTSKPENRSAVRTSKPENKPVVRTNKPEDRTVARTSRPEERPVVRTSRPADRSGNTVNRTDNRRIADNRENVYRYSDHNNYASDRRFRGGREVVYHYPAPPHPREYRRIHFPYVAPVRFSFYWTPEIRFEYINLYPNIGYYKYPVGYRVENVSAYDALYYKGEIINVYGKVYEVYYSMYTDEYILYFGAYYPYQDFTAVIPGDIARRYSPWPERYFERENLIVTGMVSAFEGVPEIVVRRDSQIHLY